MPALSLQMAELWPLTPSAWAWASGIGNRAEGQSGKCCLSLELVGKVTTA